MPADYGRLRRGESIAGYVSHSLALLSDAGHNFSDAFALGLAAYAIWISKRPATAAKTYGYHRASILTALVNSATLLVIAVLILIEAAALFLHPHLVHGQLMMWVAGASVLMNTLIAALLRGGARESMNLRAVTSTWPATRSPRLEFSSPGGSSPSTGGSTPTRSSPCSSRSLSPGLRSVS